MQCLILTGQTATLPLEMGEGAPKALKLSAENHADITIAVGTFEHRFNLTSPITVYLDNSEMILPISLLKTALESLVLEKLDLYLVPNMLTFSSLEELRRDDGVSDDGG